MALGLAVCLALLIMRFETSVVAAAAAGMFVFGDSLVDVGNNDRLNTPIKSDYSPYGVDFQGGVPTGRFSDGRIPVDFIASNLGIPTLLPYPASASIINSSANFASGGSGILQAPPFTGSVMNLSTQVDNFQQLMSELEQIQGNLSTLELISTSIFYITTANNDLNNFFLETNKSLPVPSSLVSDLITEYQTHIQRLYDLGARKIVLTTADSVGCVPINQINGGQCNPLLDLGSFEYNLALQAMVSVLRQSLNGASVVVCDLATETVKVVLNPREYGFSNSNTKCCTTSAETAGIFCAPNGSFCSDPGRNVYWDGIHPTQAFAELIATDFYSGSACSPYSIQDLSSM